MEGRIGNMARQRRKKRQKGPLPVYDTTLKDILKQHVRDILPLILPGAVYEANLNVELIRPTI
jgi:hypothetical protein